MIKQLDGFGIKILVEAPHLDLHRAMMLLALSALLCFASAELSVKRGSAG